MRGLPLAIQLRIGAGEDARTTAGLETGATVGLRDEMRGL
jgi:hypothetical protein